MQGHKKAKASPFSSGLRSDAGFFFNGWCREGYWENGTLLKGRDGRTVNLAKFLVQRAQVAPRPRAGRGIGFDFTAAPQGCKLGLGADLGYEIPVFMEQHL